MKKKILCCLLIFGLITTGLIPTKAVGNMFVAKVVEIIDGEVFKIQPTNTDDNTPIIVKLIGVDTESNQEAFDYAVAHLLGNLVFIQLDSKDSLLPKTNGWQNVYIQNTNRGTYNYNLLHAGLAKVDTTYKSAEKYQEFMAIQDIVKNSKIGIWGTEDAFVQNLPKVNINTANGVTLVTNLEDTDSLLASKILHYRRYNPFNNVNEIKFVDDKIDSKWMEKNRDKLSVITNLNGASELEIRSLIPDGYSYSNKDYGSEILNYRLFHELASIDELNDTSILPKKIFDHFKGYVTLYPAYIYNYPSDYYTVNINTSTLSTLKNASQKLVSDSTLKAIVDNRQGGKYAYTTLTELTKHPIGISTSTMNLLTGSFSVSTDINTATYREILSLFDSLTLSDAAKKLITENVIAGRPYANILEAQKEFGVTFSSIYPYINANQIRANTLVNINTPSAKDQVVKALNMDSVDATKYKSRSGGYVNRTTLNFDYSKYVNKFTLYTNINTATKDEMLALDGNMTTALVEDILAFRANEPITSNSELRTIFEKHNRTPLYNKLINYIVYY